MATKNLKTGWKRIGRSGPTVDGRTIEPQWLTEMAETYNPELFTALIWPDHLRWFNMGKVEELRVESNDEGGMDLFAIIAPNDYYLINNDNGQRLFTSMELMPNFRNSGKYYLIGLAATDEPASAATSEMRFSRTDKKALLGQFTELTDKSFDDDQPPGWFKRLFANQPEEDAMSSKALEALTARFTALETKLDTVLGAGGGSGEEEPPKGQQSKDTAALSAAVAELAENFKKLEAKLDKGAGGEDPPADTTAEQFKQVSDELKKLRADFDAAVKEAGGTPAGEHEGEAFDAANYI